MSSWRSRIALSNVENSEDAFPQNGGLAKQIADVSKSSVARLGLFIFYGSNERPPSFPIDLGVSAGCDRRVAAAAGGKYVHELRDERIIPIVEDNAPLSDPTSTRRTLADADHT
jgi:hypothetical protein